jgi:hypothetical protein
MKWQTGETAGELVFTDQQKEILRDLPNVPSVSASGFIQTVPSLPNNAPIYPHDGRCPNCGHCPHCGRGGYQYPVYPVYPWSYYERGDFPMTQSTGNYGGLSGVTSHNRS